MAVLAWSQLARKMEPHQLGHHKGLPVPGSIWYPDYPSGLIGDESASIPKYPVSHSISKAAAAATATNTPSNSNPMPVPADSAAGWPKPLESIASSTDSNSDPARMTNSALEAGRRRSQRDLGG
ncbi:hypothetical protein AAMO2058_000633700 [Amorphochlora amoebiformis]